MWYILAGVVLVFLLISRVRVGGGAQYSADGFEAWVRLGALRLKVFPLKKAKKDKPPKKKRPRKKEPSPPEEAAPPKEKLGGGLEYAKSLLPIALEAAGQFTNKIRMDSLRLELTVGALDPADAALRYGQANGALAALWGPLTRAFHVKDGSAAVRVDFDAREITVYGRAALSMNVGQICWLGLHFGWKALRAILPIRKRQKEKRKERKAA